MNKLFKKNDSGFICKNCGKTVEPLNYSSRNHCPYCLYSLHVDINPGDRAADCGGLMKPSSVAPHPQKDFIITHKCLKCGALRNNRSASDDDISLLIYLTNPFNTEK